MSENFILVQNKKPELVVVLVCDLYCLSLLHRDLLCMR